MPVEIRVPQLGESVVEATIARWLKKEGDVVATGEAITELETDKVNVEVAAEQDGVLGPIVHGEGDTVGVGDVIGTIVENGGNGAAPAMTEARPQPATTEPAPQTPEPTPEDAPAAGRNGGQAPATPVAQRLADENNLDLRRVKGSGQGGKITKDDVATFIERTQSAPATANVIAQQTPADEPNTVPTAQPVQTTTIAPPAAPPTPISPQPISVPRPPAASDGRREERVPMTKRRQTIARRLVEAQRTAAMLTTFNEVDMSAVIEVRKRRRDAFKERHGVGLGFMSFFTKAAIGALKAFPHLNAEIQNDEILVKHFYDIGVAVSTPEGLVVPVVRDADQKTFAGIEREIADLATRARDNKLTLADLLGGTFTITNGGVFGSLLSTPILNAPQVGILGMHKIEERPIALNGEVVIRPMMYLALSYDHRIVDGSEAVRFLVRVKELIEDPEALLLEG